MPNGAVTIAWGDGEYVFNIAKIAQVLELEEKCGAGIGEIYSRLMLDPELGLRSAKFHFNDIREPIRIGLVGGGMTPPKALMLTRRYVDDRPWMESHQTAQVILMAALVGVPGDEVGKADADLTATKEAMDALSGRRSTEPEPQSISLPDKSMNSPSGNSPPVSMDTTSPTVGSRNLSQ